MLSALELAGFKSFADKTRFDFPDGITVVVGPNGSGKSNIVDAIKWVLGTQSAKSLRGDDMADVIFKGSAAGGRKPCNSAEATLILDNRDRKLSIDAEEVHVTRRVFRSGESEYLINREPRRLKDIRDLFRGTGVGIDAYSLIEQGKIDRMLQASAKDRRAIFEEAAGISRFKTKKQETDRRLQRVEQSLVRLRDIVDEVHTRLTALKNQATKAQQYRQMTQRLSELRLLIGTNEHRAGLKVVEELHASLTANENKRIELAEQLAVASKNVELAENNLASHEAETGALQLALHNHKEQIAGLESSQRMMLERIRDLEHEQELCQARRKALSEKADFTAEEVIQRQSELAAWEQEWAQQSKCVSDIDEQRRQLDEHSSRMQREIEEARRTIGEMESQAHQARAALVANVSRLASLEERQQSQRALIYDLQSQIESHETLIDELQQKRNTLDEDCQRAEARWLDARFQVEHLRNEIVQRQEIAMQHQGRLQGIRERLLLLEQLEEQQEGVGRGAKKLLELAASEPRSPWNSVKGLVADLIEIDVHLAPLIDVALGTVAETVVLEDGRIIDLIREGSLNLDGRVAMMRIDRLPSRRTGEKIQLDGLRGVLGRADRLVHCAPEFASLFHYLLGTTWLVDSLSTALDLSHLRGAGLRFVTAACERIDADGTLSIGSLQTALGLVSRRSEMLAAREEIRHLEERIAKEAVELAQLQQQHETLIEQAKNDESNFQEKRQQAAEASIEFASEVRAIEKLRQELDGSIHAESETDTGIQEIQIVIAQAKMASDACDQELITCNEQVASKYAQWQTLESEQTTIRDTWTSNKIHLARLEQRLEGLRATLEQLNQDAQERQAAVVEIEQMLASLAARIAVTNSNCHEAAQQSDILRTAIEADALQLVTQQQKTATLAELRRDSGKHHDQLQRQLDRSLEQQRSIESEIQQQKLRVTELVTRYRDDYEIDLSNSEQTRHIADLEDRSSAELEISQLRQDIASVGSVNMEALQELDELQSRYDTLDGHYQDLTEAKANLLRIIEKIDVDSQRLFSETLDAIRINFQDLYRRSFGGGHADLVLEQCDDMSEAGVEIVATPPGKTAFSNSLLSGGEKALTAVALIMAIFKYRPSPFCILDEVDAPFDEANIGRFVSVLNEFLHMTKFVVVSHSKKTMTAASTIYGVTMQESGVSRQVAVRFEELKDDSEFLNEPPKKNRAA